MTDIARSDLPENALPSSGTGNLEQLMAYVAAALRFHTLNLNNVQVLGGDGSIASFRPCVVNPVETPDKKSYLYIQALVPLTEDPYSSSSSAIWEDAQPYPDSAVLTDGYKQV